MENQDTKQNWASDYVGKYLVISNGVVIFGMVPIPGTGLYMMETQVTQALYKAVVGKNPSFHKGERNPVENVGMNDVEGFIEKLNKLTNLSFRLPSADEWTKAARGSTGLKYADSNDLKEIAWYSENSNGVTHPVKRKKANRIGLYDMCGNVYEWTSTKTIRDTIGATIGATLFPNAKRPTYYIIKGGSFRNAASVCEVWSNSVNRDSDYRGGEVGFRLVL